MLKQTLKYDLSNLENILFDSYKFTAKELANHYIDLIYSNDKNIKAFNMFKLIFILSVKFIIFLRNKDMINNKYKTKPTIPVSDNSSNKVLCGCDEQF